MNVVLFYPAGLLGCSILPNKWHQAHKAMLIVCTFTVMSICIEFAQYCFALGLTETDDVIHNALGVFWGVLVHSIPTAKIRSLINRFLLVLHK